MNIYATQYTLNKKQFEIYLSGCDGYCDKLNCQYSSDPKSKCHNREIWDFSSGKNWETYKSPISEKIKSYGKFINSISIFGGEPLLQDKNELLKFLDFLRSFDLDIWMFTRFNLEDVDVKILDRLDFIKCGVFDYSKKTDNNVQFGYELATSNQKIYNLKSMRKENANRRISESNNWG